jgi:hypothetical protein
MLRFLLQNWYRYPDAFVLVVGGGRRGVSISYSTREIRIQMPWLQLPR